MQASALPDVYFSNINKRKSKYYTFLPNVRNIFKIFSSSQTAILSSDWMAVTFFAILWSSLN